MKLFIAALLLCMISPALRNSVPRTTNNHIIGIMADSNGDLFVSQDKVTIPVGGVLEWYPIGLTGCAIAFNNPAPDTIPADPIDAGDTALQMNGSANHDYKYSVTCDGHAPLDPHVIIDRS